MQSKHCVSSLNVNLSSSHCMKVWFDEWRTETTFIPSRQCIPRTDLQFVRDNRMHKAKDKYKQETSISLYSHKLEYRNISCVCMLHVREFLCIIYFFLFHSFIWFSAIVVSTSYPHLVFLLLLYLFLSPEKSGNDSRRKNYLKVRCREWYSPLLFTNCFQR